MKHSVSSTKLACYFTSWSQYRPGVGKYLPENVDPHLCTYLIYAFAVISSTNEIKIFEWNDEILYKSLIELKYRNPQLKILLAVGRARFGTTQFTIMASTPANRETFIQSSIRFFPHEDKRRFTLLCQELLAAFEKEAAETKKPRLLLTAAVSTGKRQSAPGGRGTFLSCAILCSTAHASTIWHTPSLSRVSSIARRCRHFSFHPFLCVRLGQSLREGPHIFPLSLLFININYCVESGVRLLLCVRNVYK
uniref:GH18 domain-containing protein n=1 Tax=Oryzias sinensis TaxID=183150 RepID=A0A8C7X3F6_9TELE